MFLGKHIGGFFLLFSVCFYVILCYVYFSHNYPAAFFPLTLLDVNVHMPVPSYGYTVQ